MPTEKELEDKTKADAEARKKAELEKKRLQEEEEEEEEEDPVSDSKEVKKLREEAKRWRLRAKENKAAAVHAVEADKRLKEAEEKAQSAFAEVQAMKSLSDRRIIEGEIRNLTNEFGLKKLEYARLGEGFDKLKVRDDGSVEGAKEMFDKLKKSDPDLFKAVTSTNTQFHGSEKGIDSSGKKVLNMKKDEYKQAENQFLKDCRRGK